MSQEEKPTLFGDPCEESMRWMDAQHFVWKHAAQQYKLVMFVSSESKVCINHRERLIEVYGGML